MHSGGGSPFNAPPSWIELRLGVCGRQELALDVAPTMMPLDKLTVSSS